MLSSPGIISLHALDLGFLIRLKLVVLLSAPPCEFKGAVKIQVFWEAEVLPQAKRDG